ncbi:MAG: regulatory protein RecX [Alphaproteobacteria bacterium]
MPEKKSAVKPVTQKRLMNIALYYLGRYESSAENVRRLLERRIAKAAAKGAVVPAESDQWVNAVVSEVCRLGYVNDERFALSTVEKYRKAGKSERYIRLKLAQAGIGNDMQDAVLKNDESLSCAEADLAAALRLVEKRKLGSFRSPQDRQLFRKKDLAVLARAGFSFQTAVQALGFAAEEEDDEFQY